MNIALPVAAVLIIGVSNAVTCALTYLATRNSEVTR